MHEDKPLLPSSQAKEASDHETQVFDIGKRGNDIVNTPISTVFLLLNVMIGAGYLVQPYVFKETGIIAATFYFLLFGYTTFESSSLLVKVAEIVQLSDYSAVAQACLGDHGAKMTDILIIVNMVGSLLTYFLLLGSLTSTVVEDLTGADTSKWYCSEAFLTTFWTIFAILPLCLVRKLGHLWLIAYYSMAIVLGSVLLVCIGGPILYYSENSSTKITYIGGEGLLTSLGSVVFAFGITTGVLPTYQTARQDIQQSFDLVLLWTVMIGGIVYLTIGLVGYIVFRDSLDSDILLNFDGTTLGSIFQIAVSIHLIFILPGNIVIARLACYRLVGMDMDESEINDTGFYIWTIGLIIALLITTVILQVFFGGAANNLSFIIDITGGVAGCLVYFIIPGLCCLYCPALQESNRLANVDHATVQEVDRLRTSSWILIVLGVVSMILVLAGTFIEFT